MYLYGVVTSLSLGMSPRDSFVGFAGIKSHLCCFGSHFIICKFVLFLLAIRSFADVVLNSPKPEYLKLDLD
jgi:hypothetical protein